MNNQVERNASRNGAYDHTNGFNDFDVGQEGSVDGNMQLLVEWLKHMLPDLDLPLEASEEDLRACLIDGTVLCSLLNKLRPGLIEMRGDSEPGPAMVKKFLAAMDELGLPRFVLADIQQGYMVPVLQCLGTLKSHFDKSGRKESILNHLRMRWNIPEIKFSERTDHSQDDASLHRENSNGKSQCCSHGSHVSDANMLELMRSNGLDNISTEMLFSLANKVLDESIERKNGLVHHVARILKNVVNVIEQRMSIEAENLKDQNNLYKTRAEKYQSKIRVLETLAAGTKEEIEVLLSKLEQIKIEKSKLEEKEKHEQEDLIRLKKEKNQIDFENSTLREELDKAKKIHDEHCLQLEAQAKSTKTELEKRLKELEHFLSESRRKVKELESCSESKFQKWKKKEGTYRSFINSQHKAIQELRAGSISIKHEILRAKRGYSEEFHFLGVKLKGLVSAAEKYHAVLAENRKLYNEVQDLKGNIRVYCRIRPFLPGQCKKQTTIDYIGENGELVVSNHSKQGKDSHRLFKFNKVFGPSASQEEVFLDTQPLIRSVLDGYNVCIFAYGQTGSGKTYTMSGPNVSSEEDWGVNYRALHDLFQISQSRSGSISYEVGVQMVEIYNEQVRDLLSNGGTQKRLGIWNTTLPNGLAVPEASMHFVTSTTDVLGLMHIGLMNRAVGATALNERSSRSHSVLTVHVRGTDLETGTVLRGSLHLVDLAGSERVDRSEATGERLREAQHINKSLSALGDVIFALAHKSTHVPYRNSKLTQVLQSSLGGQAKTLMFVQLNPDVDSYSETISTLKFAERVSGVELGAARSNKEGREVRELMEQVTALKDTIAKKDEEIERLQLLKVNVNGMKHSVISQRSESSSPRRYSTGNPPRSPSLLGSKGSGLSDKAASDMENSSDHSEKLSDSGSLQSMDDLKHNKGSLQQSKSMGDLRHGQERDCMPQSNATTDGQNFKEDVELLGFGDGDSDERLSDISDSGLSMGTETEGSMGSAVEFTLFPECSQSSEPTKLPESTKQPEAAKPHEAHNSAQAAKAKEKADNSEKPTFVSKLPKLPQKLAQTRLSRLSLAASSTPKFSSKSASKKTSVSSSSAIRPPRQWH